MAPTSSASEADATRLVAIQGDGPRQQNFGPNQPNQRRGERWRNRRNRPGPPSRAELEAMGVDLDKWTLISPYHTLGKVQSWVFGLERTPTSDLRKNLDELAEEDQRLARQFEFALRGQIDGGSTAGDTEDGSASVTKRDTVTGPVSMLVFVTLVSTWITCRRLSKTLSL